MLTQMSSHSASICTIFQDYNSLLWMHSSPFNFNITNKIPKFIGLMKLAYRFGHLKERTDFHDFTSWGIIANTKNT